MFARVVTGRLQPDALARAIAILEGQIRPQVASRPGFEGWQLLIDRHTGQFLAISHWGSRVEAEGASRDGFSDRAGLLRGLLDGELTQTIYEARP